MTLTNNRRNRIAKNYKKIKTQIVKNIQSSSLMNNSGKNYKKALGIADEVMGFVVVAADEYNQKKDNIGFENSVAHRALLRYQDHCRTNKKHIKNSVSNIDLVKIRTNTVLESGSVFQETEQRMFCDDVKECFDEHFPEDDPESKVYRSIFFGYIYPNMVDGKPLKSLKLIAEENSICPATVTAIMRSKEMQNFYTKYFDND